MDTKSESDNSNKKVRLKVSTYPVPFLSEEKVDNISISANTEKKYTKKEIISKAYKLHVQGNILEAEKAYIHCIENGFENPNILSNYAVILQGRGKINEAKILYQKAIKYFPNNPEAYSNLGVLLSEDGELQKAEELLLKAIKINPKYKDAYVNLSGILRDLGRLEEAEISINKAIELDPNNAILFSNLSSILIDFDRIKEAFEKILIAISINEKDINFKLSLLTILNVYNPEGNYSHPLLIANQKMKKLCMTNEFFTSIDDVKKFYNDALDIFKNNNIYLESNESQIYSMNGTDLNCDRHHLIFLNHNIIPKFCFGCYKVQIIPPTIIDLIRLYILFDKIILDKNKLRKCMVEKREKVNGFYKGLIYCSSLEEAKVILIDLDMIIQKYFGQALPIMIKRGCSEFAMEYPEYKEIDENQSSFFKYNEAWDEIETGFDKSNQISSKVRSIKKTIPGVKLNDFLIIRNWLAYGREVGDKSVNLITNENFDDFQIAKDIRNSTRSGFDL